MSKGRPVPGWKAELKKSLRGHSEREKSRVVHETLGVKFLLKHYKNDVFDNNVWRLMDPSIIDKSSGKYKKTYMRLLGQLYQDFPDKADEVYKYSIEQLQNSRRNNTNIKVEYHFEHLYEHFNLPLKKRSKSKAAYRDRLETLILSYESYGYTKDELKKILNEVLNDC